MNVGRTGQMTRGHPAWSAKCRRAVSNFTGKALALDVTTDLGSENGEGVGTLTSVVTVDRAGQRVVVAGWQIVDLSVPPQWHRPSGRHDLAVVEKDEFEVAEQFTDPADVPLGFLVVEDELWPAAREQSSHLVLRPGPGVQRFRGEGHERILGC